MEQAMRNLERTRAARIEALRKTELAAPRQRLSAYFAGRPGKLESEPAKRRMKNAA